MVIGAEQCSVILDGGWKGIIYNDAKEEKWNVLKAGLPVRQTIIHPVPGVSTEGGAADWVPILGGVNNINKILGIVPKREFSVPK